jgi:nucleoside-diphosphate-sugar epimerase
MKILVNENGCADGQIFNIGNPAADLSIRDLATQLIEAVGSYPRFGELAKKTQIIEVSANEYYGTGYQDITTRVPSIKKAQECLGWNPKTDFKTGLKKTLDYYLKKRKQPEV